jgi:DNA invertase Pin-like site-specific DNA recombinase
LGYRKIADYLNAHGIKTVRGNTWKNTQVFSVLKRYQQKLDREEVRELLKLGLSQKAVAKEMGISTASVARLK